MRLFLCYYSDVIGLILRISGYKIYLFKREEKRNGSCIIKNFCRNNVSCRNAFGYVSCTFRGKRVY